MDKNVEYYMSLPYTRELIPEPEGGWFVRIKELPNCMSQGDTPEEALRMIEDAMYGWLEVELEDGESIPEPRPEEDYSGRFVVRVPKSLHRKLVEAAEENGVSLNQWISSALAEAVGFSSRTSIKVVQDDAESSVTSWPGLSFAIKQVLIAAGKQPEANSLDETLFSSWLEKSFEEIRSENQNNEYERAQKKTEALANLLQEHRNQSPIIDTIFKFTLDQLQLIEANRQMKYRAIKAEQMQEQIRDLLGSINSPTLNQARGQERQQYSVRTSAREVSFAVAGFDSVSGWNDNDTF
ncbi:MAG: type II toxin-antitoxin system HicB family antitoxin [Anaerolineaceae bacterium]|nr:type II toxin-antitoxin system HicB family antitoxin [Anaerolineaceae bacterium]